MFNLAPIALAAHGIGVGKMVTSHPSVKDKFDGIYLLLVPKSVNINWFRCFCGKNQKHKKRDTKNMFLRTLGNKF